MEWFRNDGVPWKTEIILTSEAIHTLQKLRSKSHNCSEDEADQICKQIEYISRRKKYGSSHTPKAAIEIAYVIVSRMRPINSATNWTYFSKEKWWILFVVWSSTLETIYLTGSVKQPRPIRNSLWQFKYSSKKSQLSIHKFISLKE